MVRMKSSSSRMLFPCCLIFLALFGGIVDAFPNQAGSCMGVGGRHFDTTTTIVDDNNGGATEDTTIIPRTLTSLSLSEFGAVFTANMMALDSTTSDNNIAAAGEEEVLNNAEEEDGFDTMILSVNSPNRPFKGALIRVEPKIIDTTTAQAESILFTLEPDNTSNNNNAQLLPSHLCSSTGTNAPQAVTHTNNLFKTNISARLRTETTTATTTTTPPPVFYIDVILVEANNDTHSVYARSKYELRLEESTTETATEAPTTEAPTAAPTTTTTTAPIEEQPIDYCQICGPNAEMDNPSTSPVLYNGQEYTCGEMLLTVGPTLPAITTQDCQLAIAATAAANCRCIPLAPPTTEAPTAAPIATPTVAPTTETSPTKAPTSAPTAADTTDTSLPYYCTVCPNGVLSNGNAQVTLLNGTSVNCASLERLDVSEDCDLAEDVCGCSTTTSTTKQPTSSPTIDSSTTTITIPKCNPPCMDVQQPTNVISIVEADTQFSCLEVYNDLTPLLQIGVECEDAQNRIKYHCGCIGPIAQTTNNNRDISSSPLHTRRTTSSFTATLLATTTILFWFFLERS